MVTLNGRRWRSVATIVMTACVCAAGALWVPACGSGGSVVDQAPCERQIDCVSSSNYTPNADCVNNVCACRPGEMLCCEKGSSGCNRACRPIANCELDGGSQGGGGEGGALGMGGAGAQAGDGGQGGAGGQGGSGGAKPQCVVAADCPGPPDWRCGEATCEEGVCGLKMLAKPGQLVPMASQIKGDCQTVVCDSTGYAVIIPDAGDTNNDGKICTDDVCERGMAKNLVIGDSQPCPGGGSGYCYQGECVECIAIFPDSNDCGPGNGCQGTHCVPGNCALNGTCGDLCAPCPTGYSCDKGSDCKDGVCAPDGMCSLPTCDDGARNDGETGVDCGIAVCAKPCPDGQGCSTAADCESGVCWVGVCQPPTCTDGVKNGQEEDIDCGGPCIACP